jgi:hypothetical protein
MAETRGTSIACPLPVNIRFTSSLTPADENTLALAVLKALTSLLDVLPIAYMLRIDTTDSQVFQHSGSGTFSLTVPEPKGVQSRADVPIDS